MVKIFAVTINLLEKDISNSKNNIKSVETENKIKNTKKSILPIDQLSAKTIKLIEVFNQQILKKENELLDLKSKISQLDEAIDKLLKLSLADIKDVYVKYFHNQSKSLDSTHSIKLLTNKILIHISNLSSNVNRRGYCT
jgi:hypothetical protein